jgi:dTDP-4-dehydrorhamnose reductase
LIVILGASGYVGRRMFQSMGAATAIGTYHSKPMLGGIHFDATRMRLKDVLPKNPRISHAVVVYAESDIDACKRDEERSYGINVQSTRRVIDDLVELGIKPVFTSSEYVFDGERGNYVEDDSAIPTTVYGSQKRQIEQYLTERCEDYAVLRLAKVYGSDPGDGTILNNWVKQVRSGERTRCAYDQIFSPVHVDDVVAATEAVIQKDLSGVFHLAGPQAYSRLAMLRTLLDCLCINAEVEECSIRDINFLDHRPSDLSMSPRKLLDGTGLAFKTVLSACEELVARMSQQVEA